MAQAIDSDEKVARFRQDVLPGLVAHYRPVNVLVFGSRARGQAVEHSDLDILIVAEAFGDIRWLDRAARVRADCHVGADVELLCYTPEEYARKVEELGIVRTAMEEGVDLVGEPRARVAEPRRPAPGRVRAWWAQAERDLEQAEASRVAGRHEWACFAAQQAAEKAAKALHLHLGREARGHVVELLLGGLPAEVGVPTELASKARELDKCYVEARYPNSHAVGAPFEHYGPTESDQAIRDARAILEWCRSRLQDHRL